MNFNWRNALTAFSLATTIVGLVLGAALFIVGAIDRNAETAGLGVALLVVSFSVMAGFSGEKA
jgi:hypothetical protein